jgi:murein DD-endopeptidase MepM/ murein hydrolase activator NlpD
VKFILNKQIKYCTKEWFKLINLVAIALFIIMTVIFMKYKLVCSVSISGEHIGYVQNKELVEEKVNDMLALEGTNNIAFVDCIVPKYNLTFINNNIDINDNSVLAKIEENTKMTYKYYAVTLNGKQKSVVDSLEEAEKLVTDMKEKYEDNVKFTIGINEIYTQNIDEYNVIDIKVAKQAVSKELKKIDNASVHGVYLSQKPITGVITSRFGSRESIRSYPHNGLDIAAPYGTSIKSASKGKVIFSGDKGSYGNLIIVDCGNGVQIYYGHCSKLYAKVGDKVNAGDIIAAVGSTGNSTGNHLHFEIKINGVSVNPQNYIYK